MVVVIRDKSGVISADFEAENGTASSNGVIEVYFDADNDTAVNLDAVNRSDGKCGVNNKDFGLQYYKVCIERFSEKVSDIQKCK